MRASTQSVTARAPAKINIYLGVGPRRADGYHDLATVFHALRLSDDVIAQRDEQGAVSVECGPEAFEAEQPDECRAALARTLAFCRKHYATSVAPTGDPEQQVPGT